MPYRDPAKRKAAAATSMRKRRQDPAIRAAENIARQQRRGDPDRDGATKSISKEREAYISDDRIRAGVERLVVQAWAETPGIPLVKPPKRKRSELRPMTAEEWARRPRFRARWEADRTTDALRLAELRAAAEAARRREAEQEWQAERDALRRGYKLPPKDRPPATSTNPEDVLDDWSDE